MAATPHPHPHPCCPVTPGQDVPRPLKPSQGSLPTGGPPSFITIPMAGSLIWGQGEPLPGWKDGVKSAGESHRPKPASATPGPAHLPQGSALLVSLFLWRFVPKLWMQIPARDQTGVVTSWKVKCSLPTHQRAAQLTTAPSSTPAWEYPRPRPPGHDSQSHTQLPAPQQSAS